MEELKEKEIWTEDDYRESLEFLRDRQDLATVINTALSNELFNTILDFEAGWLENFEALANKYKADYQAVFKSLL